LAFNQCDGIYNIVLFLIQTCLRILKTYSRCTTLPVVSYDTTYSCIRFMPRSVYYSQRTKGIKLFAKFGISKLLDRHVTHHLDDRGRFETGTFRLATGVVLRMPACLATTWQRNVTLLFQNFPYYWPVI